MQRSKVKTMCYTNKSSSRGYSNKTQLPSVGWDCPRLAELLATNGERLPFKPSLLIAVMEMDILYNTETYHPEG